MLLFVRTFLAVLLVTAGSCRNEKLLTTDDSIDGESSGQIPEESDVYSTWISHFLYNSLSYGAVFLLGYGFRWRYLATRGPFHDDKSSWSRLQRICFYGKPDLTDVLHTPSVKMAAANPSKFPEWLKLLTACLGLQIFLPWGLLQEKIMTRDYGKERFTDAQFLVFSSRLMGLVVSSICLRLFRNTQSPHRVPYYKYSFSSVSNIMSSWFQYEALKYVSFPTQILAKATKIIPVMIMGKIINGNTYKTHQYLVACLISMGMSVFLLSRWNPSAQNSGMGALAGTVILGGYILFDSFTSNWQEKLRKEFKMSSMQMMFGMNLLSVGLLSVSLVLQGTLFTGISFSLRHVDFLCDVLLFSTCSTFGQLFIFFTINNFGAVIFTVIMTIRQFLSVLLSYLFYDHEWSVTAFLGIFLVFFGLSAEVYVKLRDVKAKSSIPLKKTIH